MLKKLLKYDLKYMFKNMIVFYVLALFFSITTRILFSLEQTIMINILGQISVGCMFSMIGSILFNTIIKSLIRFRDSIYKDESYLTHTLPVTKNEIYASKFLESLIFSICGFIFIIISFFIAYYTKDKWLMLKNTINSIGVGLNLNTWFILLSIIIVFFLETFNILQNGFLGIILGYQKNNNKIAYSFLYGFITFIISQVFVILILFIVGLFNSSVMSIFTSFTIMDNEIIKLLIILSILIYSLLIILMGIICARELRKGVNVD